MLWQHPQPSATGLQACTSSLYLPQLDPRCTASFSSKTLLIDLAGLQMTIWTAQIRHTYFHVYFRLNSNN